MLIYLVSAGDCEDYRIEAHFSTREKAVEYMGSRPDKFNEIEAVELDSAVPCKWMTQWNVYLQKDGSFFEPSPRVAYNKMEGLAYQGNALTPEQLNGFAQLGFHPDRVKEQPPARMWFRATSYTSFEHAQKLATELRETTLQQHPEWFT